MSTPDPNEAMGMENDPYVDEQEQAADAKAAGDARPADGGGTPGTEADAPNTAGQDKPSAGQ